MTRQDKPLQRLQDKLGYQFRDLARLQQALTHRSADAPHNERLEFLGDAVLGFVVADHLYHQMHQIREGQLTRMRSHLVRGDTLAEIARRLELGTVLSLGQGERHSGGAERTSILSDAVEAIIAAVYLDGGLTAAHDLIHRLLADPLDNPVTTLQAKDPKTRLQEHLQAQGLPLPTYQIQQTRGSQHQQTFTVSCHLPQPDLHTTGRGTNRRKAEQAAAAAALNQLQSA
ncbi:MAG: ribonuclease III [Pseudomonadota bacterium]